MNIDDRKVLPRWKRLYNDEGKSLFPSFLIREVLPQQEQDWKLNKTNVSYAEDYISSAFVGGNINESSKQAAKLVLDESKHRGAQRIASKILGLTEAVVSDARDVDLSINYLRKTLKILPDSSLLRLELGYQYILNGDFEKSLRQLQVVQQLSKDSPEIARQVSRLYTHLNEDDRALKYIRRCYEVTSHPSLLASELSLSQMTDTQSKLVRKAYSIATDNKNSFRDRSEGLAALISLEFESGSSQSFRKLRKNFKGAIPWNENALAQFLWLEEQGYIKSSRVETENLPNPFEVLARLNTLNGEVDQAIDHCSSWQNYQRFSSGPAVLASFLLSSVKQNYEASLDFISPILKTAKNSVILLNNYAYSLLMVNKVKEAKEVLSVIQCMSAVQDLSSREDHTLIATMGLSKIKSGEVEEGNLLYERALNGFYSGGNYNSALICRCAWMDTFDQSDAARIEEHREQLRKDLERCDDKIVNQIVLNHLDP